MGTAGPRALGSSWRAKEGSAGASGHKGVGSKSCWAVYCLDHLTHLPVSPSVDWGNHIGIRVI